MLSLRQTILNLIRENKFLLPGGVIIVMLICVLIARAGYSYHMTLQEDLERKVELYKLTSSMLAASSKIEKELSAKEGRVKMLESGLLKEKKTPLGAARLQNEIEAISIKRGVMLFSSKALPVTESNAYINIPVEFRLKAELPKLTELLYDINSSSLILGVDVIQIRAIDRKNPGRLDVTLLVKGMMKKP